jgi:hypothetical protein
MGARSEAASPDWRGLYSLIPFALFGVLFVATRDQWYVPFADSAREVSVASRLADGETLYRDVPYWYGPVPAYLDAFALRVFGKRLDVLVALRTLLALAGVEALRRIVRRQVSDQLLTSGIVAAVVSACFFLPNGGSTIFPYSVAALEGMVGCWAAIALAQGSRGWASSLAAGVVGGLAAGAKLELAPAGLLAVAVPLMRRRPRHEAASAILLAASLGAAAWGLPVLALGRETLVRRGFLVAFVLPEPYRHLFSTLFWPGGSPQAFPARAAVDAAASILFLAFGALVIRAAGRRGSFGLAVCFAAGLASAVIPGNREIQILVPAFFVLLTTTIVSVLGRIGLVPGVQDPQALSALGLASLPSALRQPFGLTSGSPYSGFTAPGPLVLSLVVLSSRLALPAATGTFLLGLSVAQAADRIGEHRLARREVIATDRGRVSLYACEAKVVGGLVTWLQRNAPPGSLVAGVPKPSFVLFLSGHRSPFTEEEWGPIGIDTASTAQAVESLLSAPLAAGFIVNRPYFEFGLGTYGDGFGGEVVSALRRRMRPVGTIRGDGRDCPPAALVDTATLLVPRDFSAARPTDVKREGLPSGRDP